ncbi:MAG: nitronate monooxygenase [Rhodocyclaceae bacterium]|nr:nitronate monooxygenase [Rhodocyclaceae bacterium]
MDNPILPMLGIEVPILLAPMGGAVGPELVSAVSAAGGLGILPIWWEDARVGEAINELRMRTAMPFGINLNNQYDQDRHLGEAIDAGHGVVSFFWGLRPAQVLRAKDAGMTVLQSIGTAAEAREAVDAGVDIVVAQGWEAGGHVWGKVSTMALVPAVADAVPGTPVVAAGGIADGRGIAAAMAAGADAVWVGTRFLLARESMLTDERRAEVSAATEAQTIMGKDPNERWRDSAMRWIGSAPPWTAVYPPEDGWQLAGQGVGLVHKHQPAAEIVAELWAEARTTAANLPARLGLAP